MKNFGLITFKNILNLLANSHLALLFLLILSFLQTGCNKKEDNQSKLLTALIIQNTVPKVDSIEFDELQLPTKYEDFFSIRVSPRARIRYTNGSYSKFFNLEYKTLYRTGDTDVFQNTVGAIKDKAGKNILESDGSTRVSVQPDGNSIFYRNGKYHLMTHFENYPGLVYMTEMDKKSDGSYNPKRFRFVDFSSLEGTAFLCAASHTAWDTHLSGEEDYIFDSYYYDSQVTALFGSNAKLLHVSRAPCSSIEPWTCEQWDNMRSFLHRTGLYSDKSI